jgi:hypothetical protein
LFAPDATPTVTRRIHYRILQQDCQHGPLTGRSRHAGDGITDFKQWWLADAAALEKRSPDAISAGVPEIILPRTRGGGPQLEPPDEEKPAGLDQPLLD